MLETARPCPLCDSTDEAGAIASAYDAERVNRLSFASRKPPEGMHWRLVTCASCGLLYASPAPTSDELIDAYRAAAYDSGEAAQFAAETYAGLVASLSLPDRVGAIDVGAGDGAFVECLLALGFSNVIGFEPSKEALRTGSARAQAVIREEPFRPEGLPKGAFSLVTCFQTIEHVSDPLELCRAAHRLLKGGGALVIVCHNRRALSARLLGRRSPIYDIEHLQLFDPETIRALLERAGFGEIGVRRLVNRYPLRYWLRLARAPDGLVRLLGPLASIRVSVPAGNLVAVGRVSTRRDERQPPEPSATRS